MTEMCNETPVYAISVFTDFSRRRVWGFYHELENARECVLGNWSDISERGYYRYGISSTMTVGPLSTADAEEWYEFKGKDGHLESVEPIQKPEKYSNVMFGW